MEKRKLKDVCLQHPERCWTVFPCGLCPGNMEHPEDAAYCAGGGTAEPGPFPSSTGVHVKSRYTPTVPVENVVETPKHYARWKIEPIRFCMENDLPFWVGNVIKYVMRYDAKDGPQDLKKARDYINKRIRMLEGDATWWGKA